MLSSMSMMSKMLEKVSEGMAMAVAIASGDQTLDELEDKVGFPCRKLSMPQ